MSYDSMAVNSCLKCVLIAGSLMALGATAQPTPDEVNRAKAALCQAASYEVDDSNKLLDATVAIIGGDPARTQHAVGRAIWEYQNTESKQHWSQCATPQATKRIDDLLHGPHENENAGS